MIIPRTTYRELLHQLRLLEPARTCWTVTLGALLFLAIPTLAIGGFVLGAYVADSLHNLPRVVAGGVVAIGLGQVSRYIWQRSPWRTIAARRLNLYSTVSQRPDATAWALIGDDDVRRAWEALSRAKLFAARNAEHLNAAPPDAPTLCNRVFIVKSDAARRDGDEGAAQVAISAFREAGIRARVDNTDVP